MYDTSQNDGVSSPHFHNGDWLRNSLKKLKLSALVFWFLMSLLSSAPFPTVRQLLSPNISLVFCLLFSLLISISVSFLRSSFHSVQLTDFTWLYAGVKFPISGFSVTYRFDTKYVSRTLKVSDHSRGWPEGSLFDSYYTKV